jgi:hypothetical protein
LRARQVQGPDVSGETPTDRAARLQARRQLLCLLRVHLFRSYSRWRAIHAAFTRGRGRANGQSGMQRYRRRLRLATEQIAADDPVQDALKKLLLISGRWVVAPVVTMSPKGEGSERYLYRSDRDGPGVNCGQHIHQYDLTIKAGEMCVAA